ncbi:hypothetical protein DL546_007387 [Coniochaeta pulveracea]|uniref:Uncharacterized protein n=1 Tax=Coniochaeta pulveracea TaxID=177199 RepID=A0A420YCE4_9PEZI|nr:hypothetical protein DL546_007387 [Coniochaeta pulveracea]
MSGTSKPSTRATQDSRHSDSSSQTTTATTTTATSPLQSTPSTHEDVVHFLANFSEDKAGSGSASDARTAQTEAFVKALAHQLPSSCFHVRIPDHPLLLGIGAQFEEYRSKLFPCVTQPRSCSE